MDSNGRLDRLMTIDRRVRVIVAPVKPVVFDGRQGLQALARGRPGNGAALEVPCAHTQGIQEREIVRATLAEELGFSAV